MAQDRSEPLEELDSPSQLEQKLTESPFFKRLRSVFGFDTINQK